MGKGSFEDIPEENIIFNYASSHNITFSGSYDSGYTIEEWNELTADQQDEALTQFIWDQDLISVWASEEEGE